MKEVTDHRYLCTKNMDFLRRRAKGGAAMICLGDVIVDETSDISWNPKVRIYDKNSEPGFYNMAEAIESQGARASVELIHAGMHFHEENRINYGPSDMIDEFDQGDGYGIRRHQMIEMPRDIIEKVVDSYGKAALRAKHCGFSAVLLHAGHGWLPAQFLSPILNHRTDEFGGSLENRARISMMIVDKIREYCGKDFIIEARISWKEGMYEGYQLEESIEFCKMLEAHGVDMIQVSCGSLHFHDSTILSMPSWFDVDEGHNVEAATEIRKQLHIPVGTVGAITEPEMMEKWIKEGKVDYVVIARALIADPDLPKRAMHGKLEDIRPCLLCLSCITGGYYNLQIVDYYKNQPEIGENILVLGGGFASVECAIGLALEGKKPAIVEMSDALASGPNTPYPGTGAMQVDALWTNIKKNNVQVMLNTKCVEITDEGMVCEDSEGKQVLIKANRVIAATGIAPNADIVEALRGSAIDFAWIGDCYQPGLIRTAVRQGYDTAMNL